VALPRSFLSAVVECRVPIASMLLSDLRLPSCRRLFLDGLRQARRRERGPSNLKRPPIISIARRRHPDQFALPVHWYRPVAVEGRQHFVVPEILRPRPERLGIVQVSIPNRTSVFRKECGLK